LAEPPIEPRDPDHHRNDEDGARNPPGGKEHPEAWQHARRGGRQVARDAECLDGLADALQAQAAASDEADRDARLGDCLDRRGHENVARASGCAQARGDVHGRPDVALRGLDGLAGVDADAQVERQLGLALAQLLRRIDDLEPAHDRTGGRREDGMDGVAFRLDLGALVPGDRLSGELEEAADHRGRGDVAVALRVRGEATYVGEQETPIGRGSGFDICLIDHVRGNGRGGMPGGRASPSLERRVDANQRLPSRSARL
jgi:hypothetical protein